MVRRQEHQTGTVLARSGQSDAGRLTHAAKESIRHLKEDAGAVACVRLGAARAAVLQVPEHGKRLLDDRVRSSAVDVGHEADAAGVVLVTWVVETLRWRGTGIQRHVNAD
jgi:hypothetical protein